MNETRRGFLRFLGSLPLVAAVAPSLAQAASEPNAPTPDAPPPLPPLPADRVGTYVGPLLVASEGTVRIDLPYPKPRQKITLLSAARGKGTEINARHTLNLEGTIDGEPVFLLEKGKIMTVVGDAKTGEWWIL